MGYKGSIARKMVKDIMLSIQIKEKVQTLIDPQQLPVTHWFWISYHPIEI